jgi:hypothetical protein
MAIIVYSSVQTGPKTQSGGFQLGFARPGYQVARLLLVSQPPTPAAV